MLVYGSGDAREPIEAVVLLRVHGRRPLHRSRQDGRRFDVGDVVTVVDHELGIRETQRIVLKVVHDVDPPVGVPKITLSGKLRELGKLDRA